MTEKQRTAVSRRDDAPLSLCWVGRGSTSSSDPCKAGASPLATPSTRAQNLGTLTSSSGSHTCHVQVSRQVLLFQIHPSLASRSSSLVPCKGLSGPVCPAPLQCSPAVFAHGASLVSGGVYAVSLVTGRSKWLSWGDGWESSLLFCLNFEAILGLSSPASPVTSPTPL